VERDGILALRQIFEQYVNLRPVKLYRGIEAASPLKESLLRKGVDFVIVRENSEGCIHAWAARPKPRRPTSTCSPSAACAAFLNSLFNWRKHAARN
jgi:isocitrate/isopropylmalate dehydrogenase